MMCSVAIQGVKGSYSEEATLKILGDGADIVECRSFEETFATLASRSVDYAVVPIANKIVGEIESSASLLSMSGLRVLEKLPLRVKHVLVGTPAAELTGLVSVRSHVEALKQCGKFLTSHPRLMQVIGGDTAWSIRRIVEGCDSRNAAIGSRRAAEMYGAKVLKENIADDIDNWTTFYLIGN